MFAIIACSAMERLRPVFVILVLLAFDVKSSVLPFHSYISSYRYTDCSSDPADVEAHESSTTRLQKRLLCDPPYDPYVANPHADSHRPTVVKLKVYPQSIEFDDLSLLLTFHSWLSMSWEDPHLNWTKAEFPDLASVPMISDDIWRPSLTVFKIGGVDDNQAVSSLQDCTVTMNGTVTCISVTDLLTHCAPAYQHWPFDRQNCSIRMGSWGYNKDDVVYQFAEDKADMIDYTESLEWKILSVKTTQIIHMFRGSDKADSMLFLNIILERCSATKQVAIVIPAIILMIITLTVLWLDPMSTERMVLAGLDVICHLLCIMELNWLVPSNGGTLPSILIFHMNSFIMAGLAFFLTTFLHQLKKTSIPAPDWLTSTTSLILSNKAGQFFMLATLDPKVSRNEALETGVVDDADEVQSISFYPKGNPEKLGTWHHLVTLIDRLSFVGVFLTYTITLLILIPKNDL